MKLSDLPWGNNGEGYVRLSLGRDGRYNLFGWISPSGKYYFSLLDRRYPVSRSMNLDPLEAQCVLLDLLSKVTSK